MKLTLDKTPPDLLRYHGTSIYKATTKGTSTIVVDTKDRLRFVWKKHGSKWHIDSTVKIK